jgi:ribonuclease E
MAEHAIAHEDHDAGSPEEAGAEPRQEGAPGESAETQEGRRRRRRGRRGGRRNRQRNGEGSYQGSERGAAEMHAGTDFPPVSDEDADAVAPPFDRPTEPVSVPPVEARSAYEQPAPPPPTPVPPPAIEAAPAAEPPRRRSTIREPAPIASEGASPTPPPTLAPPTPVIVTTASEDSGQPKRGWWAKRLLGDKS